MAKALTRWVSAIVIVVAVLIVLAAGGLWLIGQEVALRYVVQQLTAASGGALQVEGLSGSLYGPLAVRSVRFENAERRIEVRELALDWLPTLLWDKVLVVHRASAASVDIVIKKSGDDPLKPPIHLRLPLNVRVDQAALGRLTIVAVNGSVTQLTDLAASGSSDAQTHQVTLASITTPWGKGRAQLKLATEQPFALSGGASFQGELGHAFTADATVSGDLAAIIMSANGQTQGGKAKLQTQINPFIRMPLQTIRLEAQQVDLHDVSATLPFTQLSARLDGKIGQDSSISAAVSADNALFGAIDRERLPLRSLQGRLIGKIEAWRLEEMQLDLGPAGQFVGSGGLRDGRADVALTTRNLNLQGAYGKLRATRATGSIRLTTEGSDFSVQRLQTDVTERRLRIKLDATHRADEIRVDDAQLGSGSGQLQLRGKLQLTDQRVFQATGTLQHFNPAEFGTYPVANLNAELNGQGRLADPLAVQLQFKLAKSQLRGRPLAGEGRVELIGERLAKADLALDLAGNRLNVQGAFGRPGDELKWTVDAQQLAGIDPTFAGSIQGQGRLRGTLHDPAVEFDLAGHDLRLPGDYAVGSLSSRGQLSSGANGVLDLDLDAQGVRSGTLKFARVQGQLKGSRRQHSMQLSALEPDDLDFMLGLSGAWDDKRGWTGSLEKFANRGRYAVTLAAPAPLEAASGRFSLRAAKLELVGGTVNIDDLRWAGGRLQSSGSAQGLSIAYLQKLFPVQGRGDQATTDLKLAADWSLDAGNAVNGKLNIRRESGDAVILSDPKLPLKIERLQLAIDIVQNRVRGNFDGFSQAGGTLVVNLETLLEQRDNRWGIAGNAPLAIDAQADMPSIAWTSLFLDERFAVDGRLRFTASRRGFVSAPQFSGNIEGAGLVLRAAEYGIGLRDGVLRATFADNRLVLDQFRMAAEHGQLTATGSLNVGKETAEGGAEIKAEQLQLLGHPDYQLTVSGASKVTLQEGKLLISGDVRADRGQITLPRRNAPSLGDDVVVVNKSKAAPKTSGAVPLSLDVQLDLGEQFLLRGRGLDAQLGGKVRVKSASRGLPNASGTIQVVKGTYEAYGQKLNINRGNLSFAGPIDNPVLDIEAVRKNLAVEAGVAISGTALAPRLRLVSTPVVPDTEKLAWMVLGHGLEGSARSELELLPVAAAALFPNDGGESFQSNIARTFHVDEIGLTSASPTAGSTAEQRALTIGKRVSSNLYLTYAEGLNTAERFVRLQYELSRSWSLRAETGTRSALDLFYTLRFD